MYERHSLFYSLSQFVFKYQPMHPLFRAKEWTFVDGGVVVSFVGEGGGKVGGNGVGCMQLAKWKIIRISNASSRRNI